MALRALSAEDIAQLEARGLGRAEVERQLALLASPPAPIELDRPATVGDGIRRLGLEDPPRLLEVAAGAASSGRLSKFVPASGAATRMFQGLLAPAGDERGAFLAGLERFAFADELLAAQSRVGEGRSLVELLIGPEGLGYADYPKGLIPFHRQESEVRTAFEEHLAEAMATVRDAGGKSRVHFTVSPEHRALFEQRLARRLAEGWRLEVSFSHQEPCTDTVALGEDGQPFRLEDGSLCFRPGGHGALFGNLEASGGDVVLIKNIDNVVQASRLPLTAPWKRILVGVFLELEHQLFAHQAALAAATAGALEAARAFARRELGWAVDTELSPVALRGALDRPLRVCGMVANQGEPGGGPYWVRGANGDLSLQIVESAQMDLANPHQRELVSQATHFNPVDLVCGLRDRHGRPWQLARFVDPTTAFVTEKALGGRTLRALEHPGLWNGAMAGWITVFVEVPAETFAPVKTVLDLLRPEHQP